MKKDKVFEIENFERLFDYRFEAYDVPIWVFVRLTIIRSLFNELFQVKDYQMNLDCYVPQSKVAKQHLKSAWKTPFIHTQKDVLFMFFAAGDTLTSGKKYINRVYGDYFLAAKEKSIILQSSFNHSYAYPSIDDNMRFCDMVNFLINREAGSVSEKDMKAIDGLIEFLKANLPVSLDEKIFAKAKNQLLFAAARIPAMVKHYRRLYQSFSPKAVVLQCAQYLGGHSPIKVAVAREMGIKTIEIQHGLVNDLHNAYNFGAAALKNKAFLKCLPDYFLMFGEYWTSLVNTPAKRIAIGSPNFHKKANREVSLPENTVLFAFSSDSGESLLGSAVELARCLPDFQITCRFHPTAKTSDKALKHLETFGDLKNFNVDKNIDIYDSLYESEYVVGEDSTVLYEAACLGRKVYVLKTPASQAFIDTNLFTSFETPAELVEKVKNKEGVTLDDATKESIFGSGFPQTYLDFLKSIGV